MVFIETFCFFKNCFDFQEDQGIIIIRYVRAFLELGTSYGAAHRGLAVQNILLGYFALLDVLKGRPFGIKYLRR